MYTFVYKNGEDYQVDDVGIGTMGTGYIYLKFRPRLEIDGRAREELEIGDMWNENYEQWGIDAALQLFEQQLGDLDLVEYRIKKGLGRFVISQDNLSILNDICNEIKVVFRRFGFDVISPYLYQGADGNYWYAVKSRFTGNWSDLCDS